MRRYSNCIDRPRHQLRIFRLILLAITSLAFIRLLGAEFVRWDDYYTIHHNPRLNPPSWANVMSYWRQWKTGEFGLYMPVTYTAWSAIAALARVDTPDVSNISLNPWVFHAANLLVHLVGASLVLQILMRLFGEARLALLGALIFAVHPVQVEPVAWASGMKDVLGGTLSLAAVLAYLRARTPSPLYTGERVGERGERRGSEDKRTSQPDAPCPSPQPSPRVRGEGVRHHLHCGLAILLAALAMLAKPSAIVIGPICVVLDVLFFRRPLLAAIRSAAPMLILAIPVALVARRVQDVTGIESVSFWARPFIAGDSLAFYLRKLVLPLDLSIDYGRRPTLIISRIRTFIIWLEPVVIAVALWRFRQRELGAAALIFLLALAPTLGLATFQFQQFSSVADHYLYLPMLGVAIACAYLFKRFDSRNVRIAACIIIALLAARTYQQTHYWLDDFDLFPHVLKVNPKSFAGHNNFGTAYEERAWVESDLAALARHDGDLAAARRHDQNHLSDLRDAARHYQRAIDLNPKEDVAAKKNLDRTLRSIQEATTAPAPPAPATRPS